MAENYDVPINVKFTTDGDADAAAAIDKVAAASKAAVDESPINKQSVADEIAEMKEKESATRQYAAELDALADVEAKAAAASADKMDKIGKGLAVGGIASAAAMAASALNDVAAGIISINVEHLRQVDTALADQVQTTQEWAKAWQEGPIQALLKFTTGSTISEAFDAQNKALAAVAEQNEAQVDRMIKSGIKQADEIKKITDAIRDANEILDAKDDADSIARDRADAAAIRGGADKFEVEKKRAADDGEKEIERINRELDAKAAALQIAFENSQKAQGKAQELEQSPLKIPREKVEAERAQADTLKKEFEQQQRDFETAKAKAAEQRRGVREGVAGRVEDLTGNQEQAVAAAKAKAEAAAAKEAADARREAQREELETKRTKLAGTAAGNQAKIQTSVNQKKPLQDIGKDIGNADSEAEIAAVGEQIKAKQGELGAVTVAALKQMLEGQAALVKEIEILKQNIRNKK